MNNSTITIRPYIPEDAKELAQIYYNTIHKVNSKDYTPEQIQAWAPLTSLNPAGRQTKWDKLIPIVALYNNRIAGFVEFEANGHIDCFYIHHELQGKGVGRALMDEVFKQAKQQTIRRVFAEVSITARPFFEKQGFNVVREQLVDIKGIFLTNFLMEKLDELELK